MDEIFKPLLCQDPDCMRVIGEVRKLEFKPKIIIRITCHKCGKLNEWRFGYSELEEQFDTIKDIVEKGGEK